MFLGKGVWKYTAANLQENTHAEMWFNDDDDVCWWIVFVVWLTNERRLVLFPAGTIIRDPHHRESLKCCEQVRTYAEPEFRLGWSCAVVITTTTRRHTIKLLLNFIEIVLRHGSCPINLRHIFRLMKMNITNEKNLVTCCKNDDLLKHFDDDAIKSFKFSVFS